MKLKTTAFSFLLFVPIALSSDAPRRIRQPSQAWLIPAIDYMPYLDALNYIYHRRELHQPFTIDECRMLLNMLINSDTIKTQHREKGLENCKVNKKELIEYMNQDGFGALILLQLSQTNIYSVLSKAPID